MFTQKNDMLYVLKLTRGEELITCLKAFAQSHDIAGASMYGLGGAESATLGIYRIDTDHEYHWKDFAGPLEIVSLNGNIARDSESGEVMIHAHAAISGPDMNVSGGHVKEMVIAGTCEVFVDLRTGALTRSLEEAAGLKTLDLHD